MDDKTPKPTPPGSPVLDVPVPAETPAPVTEGFITIKYDYKTGAIELTHKGVNPVTAFGLLEFAKMQLAAPAQKVAAPPKIHLPPGPRLPPGGLKS